MGHLMPTPHTPTSATPPVPVAVWGEPAQAPLIASVAELAGLVVAAAGSSARGQSSALAQALSCPGQDDLRSLIATTDARAVLLFAPGDFGAGLDAGDAEAVRSAAARGVKVASLEPIPATLFGQGGPGPSAGGGPARVAFLPRFAAARSFREAPEVLAQVGATRLLAIEAWNTPGAGSLGAALFASMDLLNALMGEPKHIDAAYLPPGGSVGRAPESLRELHGDLTAVVRFEDARAATLVLSDQAGRWARAATLTSGGGQFRMFDEGFEWTGPDGRTLDVLQPGSAPSGGKTVPGPAARAIADAVTDLLSTTPVAPPETIAEGVMVLCETVLLSARTSQAESPASIRRMLEVV